MSYWTQRYKQPRPPQREPEEVGANPPPDAHTLDRAVDTLGAILRDFGRYAFDLADTEARATQERCEQWAAHVLHATPPPDVVSKPAETATGQRDWGGLCVFMAQHRRRERDYVTGSLTGLQQIVWTCIREFNQALLGDQQADDRMRTQLDHLQTAVTGNSIDEIRRQVLSAVSTLGRVIEERKQQQRQMEDLYARIRELDNLLEEARQESSLDPLTRLYNRKVLDSQIERTLDFCAVFQEPACLLLLDVDHFKQINDARGHTAGDAVLRALADCLASTFPRKGDCIARYGGEEFAVIFRDTTAKEGHKLGGRLLQAVRVLRITHSGQTIPITISAGLSEALPIDSAASWLERTDRALYCAKNGGRDRLEIR